MLTDYDLIVAGSGITAISHLTLETINAIREPLNNPSNMAQWGD